MKQLNIVEFKTDSGNQYIYDPCSNRIYYTFEPMLTIIKNFYNSTKSDFIEMFRSQYSELSISNCYDNVKYNIEFENAFYLTEYEKKENWIKSESDFWEKYNDILSYSLNLGVTESCNLRCKYCAYGGSYKYERTHNGRRMEYDVAKKSIDYFLEITDDKKLKMRVPEFKRVIGFYGGEPLINFELIKKCVDYVRNRKKIPYEFVRFQITSNGTLLSDKIIEYFVNENISLGISLDGPKEEHDRNRIVPNGNGTYEVILKNLLYIKEKYPEYSKRIMVKPTFDFKTNMLKLNEFFNKKEYFSMVVQPGMVNPNFTDYYNTFSKNEIKSFNGIMEDLQKDYFFSQVEIDKYNTDLGFQALLFEQTFENFSSRINYSEDQYTGNCLPGSKIFVDVNGNFHICEKVNHHFPIGNCYTGLNFEAIQKIQKIFYTQVIEANECWKCPYRKLCLTCYAAAMKDDSFDNTHNCEKDKIEIKSRFGYYYSVLEKNPHFKTIIKRAKKKKLSILDITT